MPFSLCPSSHACLSPHATHTLPPPPTPHMTCTRPHATPPQVLQAMAMELESKGHSLADAQHRFSELEALMHRIVARSSAAASAAPPPGCKLWA